jgi:hypothetical protein
VSDTCRAALSKTRSCRRVAFFIKRSLNDSVRIFYFCLSEPGHRLDP